jgi:predicted amidohydrolase
VTKQAYASGVAKVAQSGRRPRRDSVQRVTLAQVATTRNIADNLARARAAFQHARNDGADWILFPEGFLSGYYAGFHQDEVAAAFTEVEQLCRHSQVTGLIGTVWKEAGKIYNQIRIVSPAGELVGQYAKTCLCYDESDWAAGGSPLVFEAGGITFGTLICNDLWVTPGFSDGPNPHLSLKIAKAGAQVIFHAVNSGSNLDYQGYHESNLLVRAAEAKCPIVIANAYTPPEINARSGVVGTGFKYLKALPRDREIIQTVEFVPARR